MSSTTRVATMLAVAVAAIMARGEAQDADGFDPVQVALAYHKRTAEPLDLNAVAEASDAVRRATAFDRPDAIAAEVRRLESLLASADPSGAFVIQVGDYISQYDHERGEFSVQLFSPGYYVPVQAFGRQYQLVFANAESGRAIAMPKEEARVFDGRLNGMGRRVTNEIRFRVIGKGDPNGAITGQHVIRAEILSARLLDAAGNAVFTPAIGAVAAAGSEPAFDLARIDVAGFRVGVPAKDLEATLTRLFGAPTRGNPASSAPPGVVATLGVNETACMHHVGRRQRPSHGTVCVTALLSKDDVVRSIRIERVFPWLDHEVFRRAMVARYGPVTAATGGSLAWGPPVDRAWGGFNALTAMFGTNEDIMDAGLNRRPDTRITLVLVDAEWAAGQKE